MSKLPDRGIGHPAPDLEFNTMTLPAGTEIHRIHNGKWGASGFNPGASIDPKIGNVGSRFAPFKSAGAFIPTLYGGDSLGCAAFETIFHDIDPLAKFKTVSMSSLSSLKYSVLTLTKDVEATRLFSPDLKRQIGRAHV